MWRCRRAANCYDVRSADHFASRDVALQRVWNGLVLDERGLGEYVQLRRLDAKLAGVESRPGAGATAHRGPPLNRRLLRAEISRSTRCVVTPVTATSEETTSDDAAAL